MEVIIVLGSCFIVIMALLVCVKLNSKTEDSLIESETPVSKRFPSMKKGSRFIINGIKAEKISDTMYRNIDTMESLYWLARDLQYYQMISEPTHDYEAVDSGSKTESYSTPENTYVAPIIVPSPVGTPVVGYNVDPPGAYTPTHAAVHSSSHSSHSHSTPSHSHDSGSSHSSCSSSSSHSSCSSSSDSGGGSSCSSSSCGGSSCGGGD